MITLALPRTVQHKLDQTLSQWPQWQCTPPLTNIPEIVQVLSPGVSNHSILVESGKHFVVRIDGLNPASHGLNRQVEWRTLQAAHSAGLAPCPRYCNPDLGSLVCDYLPPDDAQPTDAAAVGRLLRAIHTLPPRRHRLDLDERILRYEKQLQHHGVLLGSDLQRCRGQVSELLQETGRQSATVLCHLDLLDANRLYSDGSLWALDWEYCAMASPWYDIAVVIHGDALAEAEADTLLHAYLGRAPLTPERQRLHQYGCIYRYLELVWYLALATPVLGAEAIASRSLALVRLLEQPTT